MFHVVLIHACNMRKMHWHHAFHMHVTSRQVGFGCKVYLPVLVNES